MDYLTLAWDAAQLASETAQGDVLPRYAALGLLSKLLYIRVYSIVQTQITGLVLI